MKFVVYGLAYGRSDKDIAKQLNLPVAQVTKMISGFFNTFTGYRDHRKLQETFVQRNNYLRNPFNRRRWWFTRMMTEVYNFNPASTAADMMYLVIPAVDRQLPKGASLRLTVHDELVTVAHRSVAREAAICMKENMERKFPEIINASMRPEVARHYYPNGWYAPVDLTISPNNWKECKPKSPEDKRKQVEYRKTFGLEGL
jgi:DNA polymerase I-like protein with 3'-5' exonuclease and polymerase domains